MRRLEDPLGFFGNLLGRQIRHRERPPVPEDRGWNFAAPISLPVVRNFPPTSFETLFASTATSGYSLYIPDQT